MRRQPTNRAPHTPCVCRRRCSCRRSGSSTFCSRVAVRTVTSTLVPDGCLDGDVEVCCFQEDFACLAAPADAPRVCGVLGYTLYPAKGCCITLKQLYPERPEIVLKQNNTVLCAGCVGVGEKTLWSQAIYCRPPATFLFVELRCCCLAHDFGLNIAGDGDGCILPNCSEYVPMACAFLGFMCMPKKGCCVKVMMRF